MSHEKNACIQYSLDSYDELNYPDENYAREVMQLFSIGVAQLNMDGTSKLDEDGDTINTYTTNDIRSYARVWTGFMKQTMRGNVENKRHGIGNNDPMIMVR